MTMAEPPWPLDRSTNQQLLAAIPEFAPPVVVKFYPEDVGKFDPSPRNSADFDDVVMDGETPIWKGCFNFLNSVRAYASRGAAYERELLRSFRSLLMGRAMKWYHYELDPSFDTQLQNPKTGLALWCGLLEARFEVNSEFAWNIFKKQTFTLQDIADQKSFDSWITKLERMALTANHKLPHEAILWDKHLDVYLRQSLPCPRRSESLDDWIISCKLMIPQIYVKCTQGSWKSLVKQRPKGWNVLKDEGLITKPPEVALCTLLEERFTLPDVAARKPFGQWITKLENLARAASYDCNNLGLLFYSKLDITLREHIRPPASDETISEWVAYCEPEIMRLYHKSRTDHQEKSRPRRQSLTGFNIRRYSFQS